MVLFTLAEFKEHEGIVGTADDALITSLATRISAAVDRYLNRVVEAGATDETDYYDGSGTGSLWVRKPPIVSVTSIHVDSTRAWTIGAVDVATAVVLYKDEGRIELLPGSSLGATLGSCSVWPRGMQNVRVIYRGGFDSLPQDIKEGAILWAAVLYRRRRSAGVLSHSIGDFSETFEIGSKPPGLATSFLKPYRKSPMLTGVGR